MTGSQITHYYENAEGLTKIHTKTAFARALFPAHDYPYLALRRLVAEDLPMSRAQIKALNELTGENINYYAVTPWNVSSKSDELIFSLGEFVAVHVPGIDNTIIYRKGVKVIEMPHPDGLTLKLSDYIGMLAKIVNDLGEI